MKIDKVLAMNGGQGEGSYAQNSLHQSECLHFLQPFLKECISNMKITPVERFCIADLGCSAGPNTLFIAESISKVIQDKCMVMGSPVPELQVFFSDLPSNDFNLLFQSLPPPPKGDKEEEEDEDSNEKNGCRIKTRCNYFVAGVAGSFYNRLFPKNSLHFVHSSFSLHWLSQVPPEIEDKKLKSWNGGRVHISKEGPVEIGEAYLGQFKKDVHNFLRARSDEVVRGGCMFICIGGRPDACDDPRDQGPSRFTRDTLNATLNDMVIQGMIKEEERDSFNLPIYSPSPKELRAQVEKEGSFIVKKIESLFGLGYEGVINKDISNREA
ncbi:probable methyltransferase TCM_000168 [Cryptomeria japonica]|uniref:probable methyltransferase TCM_000168 n=1 Tax=Cryptomeria japonica TaxID=3369 RepID=UPI0027DA938D|nr:probable methyltransferase TCM_000168 [Cryptomeria japonica]